MEGWSGVEVRHLAALCAVGSERSFRGAAERLGYVQSAVSQQIARLERLVGAKLVERARGHSHVELTAEGKLLIAHGDRVIAQLHAAKTDLEAAARGGDRELRVGGLASVAARVMPRVLSLLAAKCPGLEVVPSDASTDAALFEEVEAGSLDAALGELPLQPGPFAARRLVADPCVLLIDRESPLALHEGPPTLAEIAALPLIARPGWRMTELIDEHFRAAGLNPAYRYSSDSDSAIHGIVGAGLAAAIMPRLAVDEHDPSTTSLELDQLPRRTLAVYWHSERVPHPALEILIDAAATVCGRISDARATSRATPAPTPIRARSNARLAA